MHIPRGRRYSDHHLWVEQEEERLRIGMTHWGCEYLGAIDYMELPSVGQSLCKDSPFGWVETSKAITELLAPVSGTVWETNVALKESLHIVTEDPYGSGWLIVLNPSDLVQLTELMTPEDYEKLMSDEA